MFPIHRETLTRFFAASILDQSATSSSNVMVTFFILSSFRML
jgi:hypothetical protein